LTIVGTRTDQASVVIVGSGPVGLMLGIALCPACQRPADLAVGLREGPGHAWCGGPG
jgi:hypothetical protein